MDYRKRLTPVALAGEEPIAELVVDRFGSLPLFGKPLGYFWNRLGRFESIDGKCAISRRRVDDGPTLRVGKRGLVDLPTGDHFVNGQLVVTGKSPVPLVM